MKFFSVVIVDCDSTVHKIVEATSKVEAGKSCIVDLWGVGYSKHVKDVTSFDELSDIVCECDQDITIIEVGGGEVK